MAWTSTYESQPPNDNNPGYGAASIRDFKSTIKGVVENEHYFSTDTDDISQQGQHKPGTAIVDLDSDEDAVDNGQVGRLEGTTVDTDTSGESLDYVNLQILNESTTDYIKGYDQASKLEDETIAGEWTFSTAPNITGTIDEDSADTTIANKGYTDRYASPVNIEPTTVDILPLSATDIRNLDGDIIDTIPAHSSVTDLESTLTQLKSEIAEIRAALVVLGANNQFDQSLNTDDTVTFEKVTGAVWG